MLNKYIETEYKFKIEKPEKILRFGFESFDFIVDEIYGKGDKEKVRKRFSYGASTSKLEITKTKQINGIQKREVSLYKVPRGYKLENSYNKIRVYLGSVYKAYYKAYRVQICLDFYKELGCFLEIEGNKKDIDVVARKFFELDPKDNIKEGIDEYFCRVKGKDAPLRWGF